MTHFYTPSRRIFTAIYLKETDRCFSYPAGYAYINSMLSLYHWCTVYQYRVVACGPITAMLTFIRNVLRLVWWCEFVLASDRRSAEPKLTSLSPRTEHQHTHTRTHTLCVCCPAGIELQHADSLTTQHTIESTGFIERGIVMLTCLCPSSSMPSQILICRKQTRHS